MCSPTWSPKKVSGPNVTCPIPKRSTQSSKGSMTESIECSGCSLEIVVCGAASMPITPPVSTTAPITSSGFIRSLGQRPRAPACEMNTGFSERRQQAPEGVRLAVGDPHHPDAEPVEDVDPVDLVLDRCCGLERRDHRDAPTCVRLEDVVDRRADEDERLVRHVAVAHAVVGDPVGPLPRRLRRDVSGSVLEVLEDGVEPRYCEALEAVPLTSLTDVRIVLGHVGGGGAGAVGGGGAVRPHPPPLLPRPAPPPPPRRGACPGAPPPPGRWWERPRGTPSGGAAG